MASLRTYGRNNRQQRPAAAPPIKSSLWISPLKSTPLDSVFQDSNSQIQEEDDSSPVRKPRVYTKLSTKSRKQTLSSDSGRELSSKGSTDDDDSFPLFSRQKNADENRKPERKNTKKNKKKAEKCSKTETGVKSGVEDVWADVGADFSSIDNFELVISGDSGRSGQAGDDDAAVFGPGPSKNGDQDEVEGGCNVETLSGATPSVTTNTPSQAHHVSQFVLDEIPEMPVDTPCRSDFAERPKPVAGGVTGSAETSTPYGGRSSLPRDGVDRPRLVADSPHQISLPHIKNLAPAPDVNSFDVSGSLFSQDDARQNSGGMISQPAVTSSAEQEPQLSTLPAEMMDSGPPVVTPGIVCQHSDAKEPSGPSPFLGFTQNSVDRTANSLAQLYVSALHDGSASFKNAVTPGQKVRDKLLRTGFGVKRAFLQVDRINTPDVVRLLGSRIATRRQEVGVEDCDPPVLENVKLTFDSPSEEVAAERLGRAADRPSLPSVNAELNESFKNLNIQSNHRVCQSGDNETRPAETSGDRLTTAVNQQPADDIVTVQEVDTEECDVMFSMIHFNKRCRQTRRSSLVPKLHHSDRLSSALDLTSLSSPTETAELKLYRQCEQHRSICFNDVFGECLETIVKIGEGQCGEVFQSQRGSDDSSVCFKVIPVNGVIDFNGEKQKTFAEMLAEVIISKELSALRDNSQNSTVNFVKLISVNVCHGPFPTDLLDAWDEYHNRKTSENDRPDIFYVDQLFIVFQFENAGVDLELYKFESADQALSCVNQISCALAVAECQLQFEHRDLHWGNVLIKSTHEQTITYKLQGESITLPSHGILVTVIDFTLSRLETGGCVAFCDLNTLDWLFTGQDDLQFDIYRLMKDNNDNDWERHSPYSNVLWLYYLLDKLIKVKLAPNTRKLKKGKYNTSLRELRAFSRKIRQCDSATHVVREFQLNSS